MIQYPKVGHIYVKNSVVVTATVQMVKDILNADVYHGVVITPAILDKLTQRVGDKYLFLPFHYNIESNTLYLNETKIIQIFFVHELQDIIYDLTKKLPEIK
jgi:hypothetical protein